MFFKSSALAALLAVASFAAASPVETKRASASVNFVNKTPAAINFALVGQNGVVSSGAVKAGATQNLPLPPSGQGYSLKLAKGNPQSSSGILQFEYRYNAENNVSFDWSAVNGNPNPFSADVRTISPARPSGPSCQPITCKAGQDNTMCESTLAGQGPSGVCPAFAGVVLTATISGN